jgi:hypothetical protein
VTPSVERVQVRVAALGGAAALLCWTTGWLPAGGVAAGAAVVVISLWLYRQLFLAAIIQGRRRLAIGLSFVKLAGLLILGWWAFSGPAWAPDPVGFAVGVSCLPAAALWEAYATRK